MELTQHGEEIQAEAQGAKAMVLLLRQELRQRYGAAGAPEEQALEVLTVQQEVFVQRVVGDPCAAGPPDRGAGTCPFYEFST